MSLSALDLSRIIVYAFPILIGCTACATGNDSKVFRWQLDYDVEHARSW